MLRKLCLIAILAFAFTACQTEEEKAAEEFIEELENLPEPTYLTDYDACIQFMTAIVPIAAECNDTTVDPGMEERIVTECTNMGCSTTDKNTMDWDLEDCLKYYSTCAGILEDNPPSNCTYAMPTCDTYYDDTNTDTDTE